MKKKTQKVLALSAAAAAALNWKAHTNDQLLKIFAIQMHIHLHH